MYSALLSHQHRYLLIYYNLTIIIRLKYNLKNIYQLYTNIIHNTFHSNIITSNKSDQKRIKSLG
jgi:hypothetical protein